MKTQDTTEPPIERLVAALKNCPGMTCTEIGEVLWRNRSHGRRNRQSYALPAGALAKRAMKIGVVRESTVKEHYFMASGERRTYYHRVFYAVTQGNPRQT